MTDWLVLGSGSLVQTVVGALEDRPGSLRVGTANDHIASVLRNEGVTVEILDPADRDALAQFEAVDIVCVFQDAASHNEQVAEAARAAFPDAKVIAYSGTNAADHGAGLAGIADRVIDPATVVAEHILDRVNDSNRRNRQLWQVLRGIDNLGIVTHDNPDPDAIASGVALANLARAAGCAAEVCYFGDITHQENRAFVNVLDLELRNPADADEVLETFDGIALVDHSRPGVNDQLPEDLVVDIVIDHHPPRAPVDARFVDLRSHVGATSTLLAEYLTTFGVAIDDTVATALLFGIHVDTNGFTREVAPNDFEAAALLVGRADLETLERIKSPSISPQTFDVIARATQNRRVEGKVLMSFVGTTTDRDALAQAAERLLSLEGITTTMVYGVMEGTVFVSARSRSTEIDIGETLREAFEQIGNAGGHVDMAGAQITLGVLEAVEADEESLHDIVEEVIVTRFLDAIDTAAGAQVEDVYTPELTLEGEYAGEDEADVPITDQHPFAGIIEARKGSADEPADEDDTTDSESTTTQ